MSALHKWPQGKIMRMLVFTIVGLLGLELGWQGYNDLSEAIDGGGAWQGMVGGIVLSVLALVLIIGGIVAVFFRPKTSDLLIEVEQEMVKVTWSSFSEVVRSTVIIGIVTVVLAVVITAVDFGNNWLVTDQILGANAGQVEEEDDDSDLLLNQEAAVEDSAALEESTVVEDSAAATGSAE